MKISYQREIRHNYLIIDPQELDWDGYENQMISRNAIDGLLRVQFRQMEDGVRFYYEITSRQPLSRLLEGRTIRSEEIRTLIGGILRVLERMEAYLLKEESILLEPEYIYVEPGGFQVWLCLVPGLKRDFPEMFGALLEYLLGCVDHQDRESVVIAYGLYQESRMENFGVDDILKYIYGGRDMEPEKKRKKVQKSSIQEREKTFSAADTQQEKTGQEQRAGVYSWIKSHFRRERIKSAESGGKSWEGMFREETEYPAESSAVFPEYEPVSDGSRECEPVAESELPEMENGKDETIFLEDMRGKGAIRILRSLDAETEDISIDYYPFVIGKQERLTDYQLKKDTVSRIHLRIDRIEDGYQIQDLNSTNGTCVGGHVLENNEAACLCIGDEVQIANFRFRFE